MLQVQRSHTGEYTVESRRRHFGGNLTSPSLRASSGRENIIYLDQSSSYRCQEKSWGTTTVTLLKHILLYHDKASRSKCRPGRTPRYSRKELVTRTSPLFQSVGWKHGLPTLAWFIGTLVLTHRHPRSEKATCSGFGQRRRHSQEANSSSPKGTHCGLAGGENVRAVWPGL